MNIKEHKKKGVFGLFMPLSELEAYYREERAKRFYENRPLQGIKWRRKLYSLIAGLFKLSATLAGQKLTIIRDCRKATNKPVIYACTHIGRYDIEMAFRVIRESCWYLWGDPGNLYKNPEGILVWLMGRIFVDTAYKEDRYIGKETCVRLLEEGGNLLIYPEGAWNITENLVVMPLFTGTAEIAIRTGADIIPIAMEQRGKHYYANIGKNINPLGYTIEQKKELTDFLRDTLCTLRWDIWERFPLEKRADLPEDAAAQYLESIMSQTDNGYTVEEINRTRYHDRSVTSPEEAFAFLRKLKPCRGNAFLFIKKA